MTNNEDLVDLKKGRISSQDVRELRIEGLVDTGASMLIIPEEIVKKLGLEIEEDVWVRLADNGRKKFPKAGAVEVELLDRRDIFTVIFPSVSSRVRQKDAPMGQRRIERFQRMLFEFPSFPGLPAIHEEACQE